MLNSLQPITTHCIITNATHDARKGIVYLPASAVGWVILLIAVGYAVYTFIEIDSHSHSVSDTLMNFVFNLLIIGLVYSIVGYFTEKSPLRDANK